MNNFSAVILAAGEGKRMKSQKSKLAFPVCGKPIVSWVVQAVKKAGAVDCIAVVGHRSEQVKEILGNGVSYAVQQQQLGTGHAVMQAVPLIEGKAKAVVILNGDAPLVTQSTIEQIVAAHYESNNAVTEATAILDDPTGYGRIIKDENGNFLCSVEHKDATEEQLKIKEVNAGIYCFDTQKLISALSQLTNHNAQQEYYLTDTLGILCAQGEKIGTFVVKDSREILGVNDRVQLHAVDRIMRRRINERFAYAGVTIYDMEHTYISEEAEIGQDTEILPGTMIEGNTVIGANCIVGPNTRLINMHLADNVDIANSVAVESSVGSGTHVGPFAYIRPNCTVGENCKVGDFVELKNASFGNGTKASHLTYIGDSKVGSGVNFGCGTVTVNYDGVNKYQTIIEDNAFVGCNSNLISPVRIREGAYIAAGSTITDDVPKSTLAIARARQTIKYNWKDKREKNGDK